MVSVVTPTFNRARLLGRLWASLRTQAVEFEWIVVDDGSTDGTHQAVTQCSDARIAYVSMPRNCGVNAARNAGVKMARGEYILFLDSDDEFVPGGLVQAVEAIRRAAGSVGAVLLESRPAAGIKGSTTLADGEILREFDLICRGALQGDRAIIYRREVFDKCSLPEDLRGCEQVFVFEVSKYYAYLCRNLECTAVHRQNDNLSGAESVIQRSQDIARSYQRIVDNHEPLLQRHPAAAAKLLSKAMYRYLVAGNRRQAWQMYREILRRDAGPACWLRATAVLCAGLAAPFGLERFRLQHRSAQIASGQLETQWQD